MQNKYLIFDFDGVIGDTQDASAYATSVVNGIDLATARASNLEYSSNKPNHTRDAVLTDEDHRRIYTWTTKFGSEMFKRGFPLFVEFVDEIIKIDTPYKAVVSSGSQRYVIPSMMASGIETTHLLAYENHHSKEEKIEIICKDWDCDPSEVYYFTDTLADVYELREMIAKERLIGVAWGYCGKDMLLKELGEEQILDTPQDMHRVL